MNNRFFVGSLTEPDFTFDNDSLWEANVEQNVSIVGQNLSIDTLTFTVSDNEDNLYDVLHFRSSDGLEIEDALGEIYCIETGISANVSPLILLEHGTPVWYFQDDTLIGKYYIDSVDRVGQNRYTLECVSAIGLLEEAEHSGGLFYATTFGVVLRHILASGKFGNGDPIIDYAIDDDVSALPVSGWLPHGTKRENLYRLIFSSGVNITKNIDGNPRFTFLYPSQNVSTGIELTRIYDEGKVTYDRPYKRVVVLEHSYTALDNWDNVVALFDNTGGEPANSTEIWFDTAPIIVSSLVTDGTLTIVSANENGAIVSGIGTLKGIPWVHSTRSVSMGDATAPEEKTIRSEDSTLTNVINSNNLASRLYAFYCQANYIEKISNGVVWNGERPGKVYSFTDPFGGTATAFLSRANITASAVNKADCEWYANYTPTGQEGLYQHVILLDSATFAEDGGVFTLPDGVTEIKVVMIGGGKGGYSGWPGENGKDAFCYTEVSQDADISGIWYGAEGGDGGNGGNGGTPARVKSFTVQNPESSYAYTIGNGGEGGAATGFIPDTEDELHDALINENPLVEPTEAELAAMIAQEMTLTDWDGDPNEGTDGTATTFGTYSTADDDAYVPEGGVYDPINDNYYALPGNKGIRGGKGGARKTGSGGVYSWITDGESVTGEDGTVYAGGTTGRSLTSAAGLPEANFTAYGGSGAGAAVGLDRTDNHHMDGGSDQETSWEVVSD